MYPSFRSLLFSISLKVERNTGRFIYLLSVFLYSVICLGFVLVVMFIYTSVTWKKPQLLCFQFCLAALTVFFDGMQKCELDVEARVI